MHIVGFTGRKGSGKSTAAGYLVDQGYQLLSFAGPLKEISYCILDCFGVSDPTKSAVIANKELVIPGFSVSYRQLLQSLGTEWGRRCIDNDLWVMLMRRQLKSLSGVSHVVIDDVRFDNEADLIRGMGGVVIHVDTKGKKADDGHASEAGVVIDPNDFYVVNQFNDDFYDDVMNVLELIV
ncbi:MAG: hypothetical protein H7836_11225 [Magnetococcus sp. YQC-3]